MSDFDKFTILLNWAFSLVGQLPLLITGSSVLLISFIIFVMKRWVFPLLYKIIH